MLTMNPVSFALLMWLIGSVPIAAGVCFLIHHGKRCDALHRELREQTENIQWPVSHEIQ